jgi:hypothetical protein
VLKSADAARSAADHAAGEARADVQVKVSETAGFPPANGTASWPQRLPARLKDNPIFTALSGLAGNTYLTPNFVNWNAATVILDANLQRVGKGELVPDAALAGA